MNKRIEELIQKCTHLSTTYENGIDESFVEFNKELFAALIIKECTMVVKNVQPGYKYLEVQTCA